jgi:hypothetical protein
MKVVPIRILTAISLSLVTSLSCAANNPPPPPVPPPPPGLSVDGYVVVGLFIGSFLVFKILRGQKKVV